MTPQDTWELAALAISCQEAQRSSHFGEVTAHMAQLADMTVWIRFKATLLARRKQVQQVDCPERKALELGVCDKQ